MTNSVADTSGADRRRYRLAACTTGANVISKGLSMLVLYASVPLTISYLGAGRFGVWMTLASLISFLGFLDFGIGSSLLNEVAHYSVKESQERLRRLVSHALCLLLALGLLLGSILFVAARFAPLQDLFNANTQISQTELRDAGSTLAILIGASLPIVGLQRVFWGLQRAFVFHFLSGLGSLASLALLVVLARAHAPIYTLLLGTYGVQLVATTPLLAVLFHTGTVGAFDRKEFVSDAKSLVRHGTLFFILSVGGAVAWDSDYMIISKVVGLNAVVVYAVAVRMFQLVQLPLQMVNSPLWPTYADALAHGARNFLRRTLIRALALTVASAILGVAILVAFNGFIIRVWIHEAVTLPAMLTYCMAVWVVVQCGGNAFAMYLNGVRVVGPQVVVVVAFSTIAFPLKILGAAHFGTTGLVVGSIVSYMLTSVLLYGTVFRRNWMEKLAPT